MNGEHDRMARYFASFVLLTLLCSGRTVEASSCEHQQRADDPKKSQAGSKPNEPPRFKWWLHPESRSDLGLSDHQSKKIDEVWESTAPKLREKWQELEKLEEVLAKTFKETTADVSIVAQLVEKVEKLRAENAATRTVMLYRMHVLLTPEQRAKVDAIRARMENERKRQEEERKRQGKGDKR
jgi:Spy/CpxP family protein refolding chaperone